MTGRLITLEGPEGAGKTTLAQALQERLSARGIPSVLTREPGAGPIGVMIRNIILGGECLDAWTEAFLFLADRTEHCSTVIRPALLEGKWVVCDRFSDSTVVYQGYARGLDIARLRELNSIATGGVKPDLTILLDLPVEAGLDRIREKDCFDQQPTHFHEQVRRGFLEEAALEPERWMIVDACSEPEAVLERSWRAVESLLAEAAFGHR